MVAAYDEKGAIDVCVDNAKTEDIDLWYDAEVEFVCEVPKSINDRGIQVILTGLGVMSWLLFMQLCLLMLIAAILYKAVDDTKGGNNDKD